MGDSGKKRPLNIVVFASGKGTLLRFLFENQGNYAVQGVISDRSCLALELASEFKTPSYLLPNTKRDAFALDCARCLQADYIVLAGYMRIVKDPLLSAYPQRIINVHPADLRVLKANGTRAYTGANAVRDAILSGEKETRSSVHVVTEEVDAGPILAVGPCVSYEGGDIRLHQEKQKHLSDCPALLYVLNRLGKKNAFKGETCVVLSA